MTLSLIFTGHMVDLPGRKPPRFPPEIEEPARRRIGRELDKAKLVPGRRGFASAARGGDILFHEACRERGIDTVIVLPFVPDKFVGTSVAGVPDGDWENRFWNLWNGVASERRLVLDLPVSDAAYAACNTKVLELARRHGRIHLLALWDGGGGDGPGGTADLVAQARAAGDQPVVISPQSLRS
jgi:hypothetical protein